MRLTGQSGDSCEVFIPSNTGEKHFLKLLSNYNKSTDSCNGNINIML